MTVNKKFTFHTCDFIKFDFYKFKAEYEGDSQEICMENLSIYRNKFLIYNNTESQVCFTTELESLNLDNVISEKWSRIFVELKNTQFQKICNYL